MKRWLPLALPLALAACSFTPVESRVPSAPRPPAAGPLLVGTARVDITPPPGVSTFGHAPDAHVTQGYWTRLQCRVFVVQTAQDERVAFVPCDLAAISGLLHQKVISLLGRDFPATRVMIGATHTHAGPAHYFESYAYGGITSTHLPGYDPKMVDFLGERIAQGVRDAASAIRPAVMRWQHGVAWDLTRNRSVVPFEANCKHVDANCKHPDFGPLPVVGPRAETAIDPRLDILELEEADANGQPRRPLGWLVFFPMHPTVLPATNRLLGGDTHAATSRMLESELRRITVVKRDACVARGGSPASCAGAPTDPLVGIFNTNEGDISPRWSVGDHEEVLSVASRFARHAVDMYDGQADGWKATAQLDARYVQRTLPGAPLLSGVGHLCDKPELGNATGHGASDHRASLDYVLKMGADVDTTRKNECQRPKAPLLGSLQNWLLGPESERYPTEVAFGLVRVDKVFLSFMPAELTVHAGAMVNDRVFADLTGSVGPGLQTRVVGLANSYIQYVTTPSEYAQQYYEAGSTLYGPASAEYMSDQAHILVQSMLGSSVPEIDLVRTIDPETAPERARLAQPTIRALAIQHRASEGLCRLPGPDVAVCFWWVDGSPGSVPIAQPPAQNLSWLQIVDSNGAPLRVPEPWPALGATRGGIDDPMGSIDDRGVDFFTTVRERDKTGNGYRWATVFKPSPTEWSAIRAPIRIRARASDGAGPVDSPLFVPTSMPLDCTPEQLPRCVILQ